MAAWGDNAAGQIDVPVGLGGVTAIAAGYTHSLALKADGTVVAWGGNLNGETDIPAGLTGVTAIAAGGLHRLALQEPLTPEMVISDLIDYIDSLPVHAGISSALQSKLDAALAKLAQSDQTSAY